MDRFLWIAVFGLAGCAEGPIFGGGDTPEVAPVAVEAAPVLEPSEGAADDGAPAAAADGAAAVDTAAESGNALGQETVALGDPSEGGLWLKTALVSAETQGVATAQNGESVPVLLRPLDGAGGAQISLQALQSLGLPLTGLSPVTVSRG
ncbi:MAG: hypothetical protein AAF366_05840 [Pseudomonadota bacterium]